MIEKLCYGRLKYPISKEPKRGVEDMDPTGGWWNGMVSRPSNVKRIRLQCPVCGRRIWSSVDQGDGEIYHTLPPHKPKGWWKKEKPRRKEKIEENKMKEITTRKENMRTVEVPTRGYYTEITYETVDGKIFKDQRDALIHEADLRYDTTPYIEANEIPSVSNIWHKARDEDELDFMTRYISRGYGKTYGTENLKVNEWFTVKYEYDSDGPDTAEFVPLSEFKKAVDELMEKLKEK